MKPEPNDFNDLVKLLALKRQERPPREFFHDFSGQVIARLATIQNPGPAPWWQRCREAFEGRPLLVAAYSVAVCGLLLSGLSLAQMIQDQAPAVALEDDFIKEASLNSPWSPQPWTPRTVNPLTRTISSISAAPAHAESTLFPLDDFRPKMRQPALYYNGN